jgi:protocatechuate 3,4-dioxygenase beta subunit
VLDLSGVVRSDIRSSVGDGTSTAQGVPMRLELVLTDLARGGSPFAGAAVYVWHCDREGRYSMYSDGVLDQNYLRGVQVAGADGTVRFTSVFPGCYPGRWPHVHLEVYPDLGDVSHARQPVATSQVALPRDACAAAYATTGYRDSVGNLARLSLDTDPVFGDDGAARQLATVSGDPTTGYAASLAVGVDRSGAGAGG